MKRFSIILAVMSIFVLLPTANALAQLLEPDVAVSLSQDPWESPLTRC